MRGVLLVIIVAASLPAIFVKPHIGLLVYSWISYMNPHRLVWGFAANLPYALLIAAVTMVAWFLSREPKRIPMTTLTTLLIIFTIWVSVTTVFALDTDAFNKWENVMKVMLMTFITIPLITTPKRLEALVWVIAISIGYFGVKGGVFSILTGGNYRVWGPPGSFIGANNSIAIALLMTIPLMRYLQLQYQNRMGRWLFTLAMLLCAVSVLASYSRGAMLAAVAMGLFFFFKSRQKILIGIVLVVAIAGALATAPPHWYERMESIETFEQDGSAMARLEMWRFMWNVALDNPVLGGGFNIHGVRPLYQKYDVELTSVKSPHSAYFEVLGEHGFVGLMLYVLLGITMWGTARWIARAARGRPELKWASDFAPMVQVSIIGFAVGVTFINKAYFEPFFHLAALLVVTKAIVVRQLGTEPQKVAISPANISGASTAPRP